MCLFVFLFVNWLCLINLETNRRIFMTFYELVMSFHIKNPINDWVDPGYIRVLGPRTFFNMKKVKDKKIGRTLWLWINDVMMLLMDVTLCTIIGREYFSCLHLRFPDVDINLTRSSSTLITLTFYWWIFKCSERMLSQTIVTRYAGNLIL